MIPEKGPRQSWDEYFMSIAQVVATRATCNRKHVGAVIVRNKTILSTGYNGSSRGLPHCDDVGHEMVEMGDAAPLKIALEEISNEKPAAGNSVEVARAQKALRDYKGRGSCIRTAHAEANAIAQAARTGAAVEGAVIYTTASPCYDCLKLILNAGIGKIVCLEYYASRYGVSGSMDELAKEAGVEMVFLTKKE